MSLKRIGKIRPRHAAEISASNWSVGGETLDRDFAVYSNYQSYLGPLGAKKIRLQAGWAKCEREPGVYHWAWLDEIVDNAISQGVQPWLETSYGNPIYPGGGDTGLGGGIPVSEPALTAWDNWVRALVRHFAGRVLEWEIWNEPDIGDVTAESYADFCLRTAAVIRAENPSARILALALAHKLPFAEVLLKVAAERNQLHLIDAITYHVYPHNPDDLRDLDLLRGIVSSYRPEIQVIEGETGAPSTTPSFGALSEFPWTERKQAKWILRRMLAHLAKDVPYNIFTLADLNYAGHTRGYAGHMNTKGLLRANEDKTISGPKIAYAAVQSAISVFDDHLVRLIEPPFTASTRDSLALTAFRHSRNGGHVVATWFNGTPPDDSTCSYPVDFHFPSMRFRKPAYVDLCTGCVYALENADGHTFRMIPVYDSPILIADQSTLTLI